MNALITGIDGFVGTHLAEHLLASGDCVIGCTLDGRPLTVSSPEGPVEIETVAWRLPEPLSNEARRRIEAFVPDCIYHLAAISVPGRCGEKEPTGEAMAVNVEGTRRAVELALRLPSRPRFLFAGTCHVYAPGDFAAGPVDEYHPVDPPTGYGKSKLLAEQLVRQAVERDGLDAVLVRAFQHTGPRQQPPMLLPQWCVKLLRGDEPVEVASLDVQLDLSDVCDMVRAYRRLVERGESGEIYNVGSGRVCRTGWIGEELLRLHGREVSIIQRRPGERWEPIADVTKLTARIGMKFEIPLEKTIADCYLYWKERFSS